jgi:hypothetical protein
MCTLCIPFYCNSVWHFDKHESMTSTMLFVTCYNALATYIQCYYLHTSKCYVFFLPTCGTEHIESMCTPEHTLRSLCICADCNTGCLRAQNIFVNIRHTSRSAIVMSDIYVSWYSLYTDIITYVGHGISS